MIEINNKQSQSPLPHILILGGGVLLFLDSIWLKGAGLAVVFLGAVAIFAKTGIDIDPDSSRYRDYFKIVFFKLGKWKPLPAVTYIALVRVRLSQLKFRPSEATFKQSDDKFSIAYNVNLIMPDSTKRYLRVFTGDLQESKELAEKLAGLMLVDIYDCSTSQKKWIRQSEHTK